MNLLHFFLRFKFPNFVFNGCRDLTILCPSLRDIAVITVKGVAYGCVIHVISKSIAIYVLENSLLEDR